MKKKQEWPVTEPGCMAHRGKQQKATGKGPQEREEAGKEERKTV